jgi:hypothetical protein
MNKIQNILDDIIEICQNKNVNPDIFHKMKSLSKYKNEIQEAYTKIIGIILTGIPIHKTSINNDKDTIICSKGVFEKFLEEEIINKYPQKVWQLKREKINKFQQKKKVP